MTLVEAYKLACHLHRGQVDKAGEPYIHHLTRVAIRVVCHTDEQLIAALLHDCMEDGRATERELLEFGVPEGAVDLIRELTHTFGSYEQYLRRLSHHARLIKRADIADNSDPERLAKLHYTDAERLQVKYQRALEILDETQAD